MKELSHKLPETGWQGVKSHWRNDLIAAFSVALVALPLGLGIAYASGAPPITGVFSAIVGGLITTFIRGTHVAINGPPTGTIAILIYATNVLGTDVVSGYRYVLAAIIFAGVLQIVLGLFKMGSWGNIFPSSVINGMLAAIGIIIVGKQLPSALGVIDESTSIIRSLINIPVNLYKANPFTTIIALNTVMILAVHHKIKSKFVHFIPATIWAVVFAIPLVYVFDFFEYSTIQIFHRSYDIGPYFLVRIPNNILDSIILPDFSKVHLPIFWLIVFSIALISSIENLLSAKAVDKLDPYNRKSNLNKDLVAEGISTMICGMVGGLPITTTIIRSSININHGAKTQWSNFYHGIIVLAFLIIFADVIQKIPLAALAGILIFTGYRLAAPRVFKDTYAKGPEQLVNFVITLIATLFYGLIWGIVIGMLSALTIQMILSKISPRAFFMHMFFATANIVHIKKDNYFYIKIRGVANFFNLLKINNQFTKIPKSERILMDFAHTKLIDYSFLEFVHEYEKDYKRDGGKFDITGLDIHHTYSDHPNALHLLSDNTHKKRERKLTKRQRRLAKLANTHQWDFQPNTIWHTIDLTKFLFFESRPIEYKKNILTGIHKQFQTKWEICDVTFDEGVLLAADVFHSTIEIIQLPFKIPVFTLEKEVFFDKLMQYAGYEDIDFKTFTEFSDKFILKGPDRLMIRRFFDDQLLRFFEEEDIYHLESNGTELLLFRYLRLASPEEIVKMHHYSSMLVKKIQKKNAKI